MLEAAKAMPGIKDVVTINTAPEGAWKLPWAAQRIMSFPELVAVVGEVPHGK